MKTRLEKRFGAAVLPALLALTLLAPAGLVLAHPGDGGGGGRGGGGGGGGPGAGGGGGGHFSTGGGAHFDGGARFSNPGARFSGPGARISDPGPRFVNPMPRYGAAPQGNRRADPIYRGPFHSYSGSNGNYAVSRATPVPHSGIAPRAPIQYGRSADARGRYGPGASYGRRFGGEFERHHWDGGYWRGHYWPPVFYGVDFAWFVPVLPTYCVTYWWGGTPYYYYNEAYYTWSADDGGYVATEPPPVADDVEGSASDAAGSASDAGSSGYSAGYSTPDGGNLYAYPTNGQSPEQQTEDRRACAEWAASQSPDAADTSSRDYQRALGACLTGRGYSVD